MKRIDKRCEYVEWLNEFKCEWFDVDELNGAPQCCSTRFSGSCRWSGAGRSEAAVAPQGESSFGRSGRSVRGSTPFMPRPMEGNVIASGFPFPFTLRSVSTLTEEIEEKGTMKGWTIWDETRLQEIYAPWNELQVNSRYNKLNYKKILVITKSFFSPQLYITNENIHSSYKKKSSI